MGSTLRNMKFNHVSSQAVDKTTGLCSDQTIRLRGFYPFQNYPDVLRRIHSIDPETKKHLVFLTNNFSLPALTIAQLYKARWGISYYLKTAHDFLLTNEHTHVIHI